MKCLLLERSTPANVVRDRGEGVVVTRVNFVGNTSKTTKENTMNRFLATTAVALLMGAAPALAQAPESPTAAPQGPPMEALAIPSVPATKAPGQSSKAATPTTPSESAQFLDEQKPDDWLASTLIDKPAVNSQGETIGDVNDLVTDRNGKVIAALIGVGGFLGIGEKDVAVRFEDLKLSRDENDNVKVTVNVSKDMLASAPDYKTLEEQQVVEGLAKSEREDNTRTY
jgi:sporulation protein YlmC with PRC-barrel domain